MIHSCILLAGLINLGVNNGRDEITIEEVEVTPIVEVYVPAKETGALSSVEVKIGDHVTAGGVIARQETDLAEIALQMARIDHQLSTLEAQSDLDRDYLELSLESARNELTRSLEANREKPGTVPEMDIDRLRVKVEQSAMALAQSEREFATAKLKAAQSLQRLDLATKTLERHTIRAPIDGRVDQFSHHRGEWLKPGDAVARIVTLDQWQAVGYVEENRLPNNVVGSAVQMAVVLRDGSRAVFSGTVVEVSRKRRSVTGLASVRAHIRNDQDRLRPGMRGTLTIQVGQTENLKPPPNTQDRR